VPSDLFYWPAVKLVEALRTRQVSAEEMVNAHLRRIDQVNGTLNAVVQLAADRALAEAQKADALLAQGQLLGPLHGLIKDSFDTEGIISTAGTKGRAHFVPAQDATIVARLRAAGAIVLGKTNTPELTMAIETDNYVYGPTNNPFDLARSPGGSTGGAAAIVQAGGSPLDFGSDTGGSLRWPAHCCGLVSLKPTSGRVSRAGHILPGGTPVGTMTQVGPIAREVSTGQAYLELDGPFLDPVSFSSCQP
jgi:amidase